MLSSAASVLAAPAAVTAGAAAQAFQSVPAWFEPNQGYADPQVKYYSRGAGYTLFMEKSGVVMNLAGETATASMRISLAGGNSGPELEALDPLPGRSDYFLGNQPNRWKRAVPHFARVRYRGAYPGIDVVYYGSGKQLEYDFVVSPGADPSRIRIKFGGAQSVRLDENGSLAIGLAGHEIHQLRPLAHQDVLEGGRSRRVAVEAGYVLAANNEVSLVLGQYDKTCTLVIDPILTYAGYFGGSVYDVPAGMTIDSTGNVWLTGASYSAITPPEGTEPYKAAPSAGADVFVAKLRIEPSGPPTLLYLTYLGGAYDDRGGQIEVDTTGKVYLAGTTSSPDFPVSSNALLSTAGGDQDGFAAKLDPDAAGTASLVYSTFLGGELYDVASALYVDPNGLMLVGGYGASVGIKAVQTDALQAYSQGSWDAFIIQIDPNAAAAQAVKFATYLGGGGTDMATGVAADRAGNIYLSGYTMSDNFPVAGDSYQGTLRSASNAFVVKIDPTRSGLDRLVYGTYIGGSALDVATAMHLDSAGGIWLTGYTLSPDFPVTANAYQPTFAGVSTDVFLARLDPALPAAQALTYSTFFGGSATDIGYGIELLGGGRVAFVGYTLSNDLPLAGALAAGQTIGLAADAFVAVLDPAVPGAGGLVYSTFFGGSANDVAARIKLAGTGSLLVAGYSGSPELPVTDGSQRPSPGGSTSGFILRLDPLPGEVLSIPSGSISREQNVRRIIGASGGAVRAVEPQPRGYGR